MFTVFSNTCTANLYIITAMAIRRKIMRMYCIALSLVLVTLIALLPLSVAYADGPVMEGPFHDEGTYELLDCGSFQILDVYELNYTEKWFFDKEGNPLKLLEQVWGTDTLTNSVS